MCSVAVFWYLFELLAELFSVYGYSKSVWAVMQLSNMQSQYKDD